ncbi:MAG: redoxin domain-containing protein [Alphaproteobacteria bacterium]|nr:redoxin domain-containing protein [Alphaproteobacteria bacterium]
MQTVFRLAAASLLLAAVTMSSSASAATAYDFDFVSIEGAPMPLKAYQGKALLVVNTASFCGYTPQYKGLEALWRRYQDKGLVVVGVPSDSFNQEYDDNAKIKKFCDTSYSITFPLTESGPVKGNHAFPFYQWVKQQGGREAVPSWNFNKVLIDSQGRFVRLFRSDVTPDSPELNDAIQQALPAKP